jgi:hypothetical protein
MKSIRTSVGYVLVCFGLWIAFTGCLIGAYDTIQWLNGTPFGGTSLQSVLGAPSAQFASWQLGLWVQPLWLLAMLGGSFLTLLGAALIDRRRPA